jgi:toxin ParE1/3/4
VKTKPVIPRGLANRDVDEAIAHYLNEGGERVALRFVDALERAYTHIGRQPATGSPRYAHELNIPGLRSWPLARFPYLVFYVERPDRVDVWRVLHGRRDIPAWMRETEGPREH